MFNTCDLHGSFFHSDVMLLSPACCEWCESTWTFFPGIFWFRIFRTDLILLNICLFPILVGLQSSSPPIPPFSAAPEESPSHVRTYFPLLNRLRGEGLGQHACSGWYTCSLKSRVIRRGNVWLEAVFWPYPMWVLPSKIIMVLFKINSK